MICMWPASELLFTAKPESVAPRSIRRGRVLLAELERAGVDGLGEAAAGPGVPVLDPAAGKRQEFVRAREEGERQRFSVSALVDGRRECGDLRRLPQRGNLPDEDLAVADHVSYEGSGLVDGQ